MKWWMWLLLIAFNAVVLSVTITALFGYVSKGK